ncbi:peroxisomal membrane protein 11C isoform X2 [Melopsittacus undulatus]|uniref:peroxisomal membrane protein 11C isoform X2 n=1 Tax=Melopsittacus undulatus TaxID=13146 RepID=UPI00146BC470|nr:peroxisomal membrane protein 11C isoform X2 [Melopsittacus undulatus]
MVTQEGWFHTKYMAIRTPKFTIPVSVPPWPQVRALCYGCQLAGGALAGGAVAGGALAGPQAAPSGLPRSLLAVSAELSACRTALRLFDDLAMLSSSCGYGLGPKDEDGLVRVLSVLCNVANQLYYPCEHMAWAADAGIIRARAQKWWTLSMGLWASSLLLGILRSLRILGQLRKLKQHKGTSSPRRQKEVKAQVKAEVLSILAQVADLSNAIHWLPPGFLWAGRFPPWLVGLLGTVSSLIGIYQASRGGHSEAA